MGLSTQFLHRLFVEPGTSRRMLLDIGDAGDVWLVLVVFARGGRRR